MGLYLVCNKHRYGYVRSPDFFTDWGDAEYNYCPLPAGHEGFCFSGLNSVPCAPSDGPPLGRPLEVMHKTRGGRGVVGQLRALLLVALLASPACGGHWEPRASMLLSPSAASSETPSQETCDRLNSRVRFWGASAALAGSLTGSNGIAVAAADVKNESVKLGLGISAAVASAWAALSAYMTSSYVKDRERSCMEVLPTPAPASSSGVPTPGKPSPSP